MYLLVSLVSAFLSVAIPCLYCDEEIDWNKSVVQFAQDVENSSETSSPILKPSLTKAAAPTYEQWQAIAPYLLPDTHQAKQALDAIFTRERANADLDTLKRLGFSTKGPGSSSRTVVAKHPDVKGVVIKLFLDDQEGIDEVKKLMNRIRGAELARSIVAAHQWEHLFKVPRKWIYILPSFPAPKPDSYPKYLILVAEDMKILSRKKNYYKWHNMMTLPLLNAIFIVLTEGGFYDAMYAFNMPFSTDGRIALVDLEQYQGWPVPYHKLSKYLNSEMRAHWDLLIQSQTPDCDQIHG